MNIKPEQIPDEAAQAALEKYYTMTGVNAQTCIPYMKAALAAALPVLLGEPVAFSVRSADGELSKLGFFPMDHFDATKRLAVLREGWHYVFAYHIAETAFPTQDTPNEN